MSCEKCGETWAKDVTMLGDVTARLCNACSTEWSRLCHEDSSFADLRSLERQMLALDGTGRLTECDRLSRERHKLLRHFFDRAVAFIGERQPVNQAWSLPPKCEK